MPKPPQGGLRVAPVLMRLCRFATGLEMHMLHETKDQLTAILWDSVMEPTEVALNPEGWKSATNHRRAAGYVNSGGGASTRGETWFGAPSFEVLQQRLREGWPEGSQRLLEIATRDINPASIRRRRVRADQGDEVDMQAVWRGDMSRAWTRTRRQNRTGVRSVSIIVNIGASANVTADKLFWRGASALKLASALTEAGYSVAIYGAVSASGHDVKGTMDTVQFVGIKDEDQPLDLDRLAALTAMPGYFRTSLFAGIAKSSDLGGKVVDDGLGSPKESLFAKAVALLPIPQNAIIQKPVTNQAAAEAWIDEVLGQIETPTE